jgi:molecular chaperone DnaK (HSP70)
LGVRLPHRHVSQATPAFTSADATRFYLPPRGTVEQNRYVLGAIETIRQRAVYGIDLGTSNSSIAYVDDNGRPVSIRNAVGDKATPSVVYFEGQDRVVVGAAAKNSALLVPHLVATDIKRVMGLDTSLTFHGVSYTPEMISALILKELTDSAARDTGREVRDVVISVPAYFGVAEREATRRAGEIAALNVLDVIADPVSAALFYAQQSNHGSDSERHLLVYDLGGGTFDTTVIQIQGDDIHVICTDGDARLGGADWDEKVRAYLLDAFTTQHPGLDPMADEVFMQNLAITAEGTKQELSVVPTRRRMLRFAGKAAPVELSRGQLEELTSDLLERTLTITERTLDKARRKGVQHIDEVILVGGMTRMPAVAMRLAQRFGLDIQRHQPDLAVSKGAALFASITQARQAVARRIQDSEEADPRDAPVAGGAAKTTGPEQEIVENTVDPPDIQSEAIIRRQITTVVSRSLGVKVIDHHNATQPYMRSYIVHLLPANTPLPAISPPIRVVTGTDEQVAVDIEVWEQNGAADSKELSDNHMVGRVRLRSEPRIPTGSPIEITFSMDETGALTVHAMEPQSGHEVRFDLQIGEMDQVAVDAARAAVHEVSTSGP